MTGNAAEVVSSALCDDYLIYNKALDMYLTPEGVPALDTYFIRSKCWWLTTGEVTNFLDKS